MHATLAEGEVRRVAHAVYPAAHRAVIRQLHQRVAHHHMIVLVCAHEARQHHLAGQRAAVPQDARLGPQHHLALLAHREAVGIVHLHGMPGNGQGAAVAPDLRDIAGQEIDLADEVRHKLAVGVLVDLLRGAHLGHHAPVHDDDFVGNGHGFSLVVGHIHCRDAQCLLDAADFRAHGHPQLGVQVGQGLVKQQHARLHHHGAGQGHALLLPAGELVGHAGFHAGQLHQLQDGRHAPVDFRLGHLAQPQAIGHVVKHVVVGEQRIALKHHGGIALVGGEGVDGLLPQVDFTLVRAFKAGNHPQGGGFAAARGPQQRHKAARLDVQGYILHRVKGLAGFGVGVDLGNMVQPNPFLLLAGHVSHSPSGAFACWFRNT